MITPQEVNKGGSSTSSGNAILEIAWLHFNKQDWPNAAECLSKAVAVFPRRAEVHAALAISLFQLGRVGESAVAYDLALNLSPNSPDLLTQADIVRLRLKQGQHAEQFLLRALKIDPNFASAKQVLSEHCRQAAKAIPPGLAIEMGRSVGSAGVVQGSASHTAGGAHQIQLDRGLTLKIGAHSYINDLCIRNPAGAKTHVCIGKFCSIAKELTIIGYDHRTDWITTFPFLDAGYRAVWPGTNSIANPGGADVGGNVDRGSITIGNDVWIGHAVKLFKGVTIGDGAVIGACSLVNKDVLPYTVVAGIPARPIRKRFSDDQIAFLLKIAWWNWSDERINRFLPFLCSADFDGLKVRLEENPPE